MARIPANSGNFEPLPIEPDILIAKITNAKDQDPPAEHPEWKPTVNVEFTILEPVQFEGRKVWRNVPQTWPTADKKGTTLLFDLANAFDPDHAVKGEEYDTLHLINKVGRIMVENRTVQKGPNKGEAIIDANGNQKQQPKAFYRLQSTTQQAVPAVAGSTKVGTTGQVTF